MKLRFLSLFLVLGMFALGTNVMAEERGAEAPAPGMVLKEEQSRAQGAPTKEGQEGAMLGYGPKDILGMVCKWVHGLAKAPEQCKRVCENTENPIWADLTCCIRSAQLYGKLPPYISTAAGPFCDYACAGRTCGKSKPGTFLAKTCGAVCCRTEFGTVANCLKQIDMTCDSKEFKIPEGCKLPEQLGEGALGGENLENPWE